MSELKKMLVQEFIQNQKKELIRIEERLKVDPMSYESKINLLVSVLKKGIVFGIEKGVLLEEMRRNKVNYIKALKRKKQTDEMFFAINNSIAEFRNQPKIKYSKKKYKERKKVRQLSFLKQLWPST